MQGYRARRRVIEDTEGRRADLAEFTQHSLLLVEGGCVLQVVRVHPTLPDGYDLTPIKLRAVMAGRQHRRI